MKHFVLSLSLFVFFLSSPLIVSGSGDDYYRYYRGQIPREGMITLNEAMERALEAVPGEVIKAEWERGIYEVKIFSDDGWATKVYVDPVDGSIIRPSFYKRGKPNKRKDWIK